MKELHPDRHPHASSAEIRERERETAALNAAYAVLLAAVGEDARTRAAQPVATPVVERAGEPIEEQVDERVDELVDEHPDPPPDAPPRGRHLPRRRFRLRRSVAAVSLMAAVLVAAAVAVIVGSIGPSAPGLAVGRCVVWSGAYTVVPCTERHDGRVSTVVATAGDCPSGSFTRADRHVYCIDVRS